MKDTATSPIPPNVAEVLALFTDQLDKVAFPDLSAETLKKHGDQVQAKLKQVQKAEVALASAQQELNASQQDLTALAARALAYARIYAEDKPELAQRLEAIKLRPPKQPRQAQAKAARPKADKPKKDRAEKQEKPAAAPPEQPNK